MLAAKMMLLFFLTVVVTDNYNDFYKHAMRVSVKFYPCKVPNPRVLYPLEIIDDALWNAEDKSVLTHVRPFATVLHRCDGSGCCNLHNERCKAKNHEMLNLTFLVLAQDKFVQLNVINHTECACASILSDPKK